VGPKSTKEKYETHFISRKTMNFILNDFFSTINLVDFVLGIGYPRLIDIIFIIGALGQAIIERFRMLQSKKIGKARPNCSLCRQETIK
jgi:hypothetical protein